MGKFHDKFDPNDWAEIYESSTPDSTQWGFHRATEISKAKCLAHSTKNERWLDVGSGTGHLTDALSKAGLKSIGFDHDRKMISASKHRFSEMNVIQADASKFPFMSEIFDGIIAVSVMGCFDSPEQFYKEAYRALKPGGFLIFTCTNRSSLLLKINARLKTQFGDSFHLYTLAEVSRDLRKNNFDIVDSGFYNFFLNPGKTILPSFRIAKSFEHLGKFPGVQFAGRNFFVVAKRL